MGSRPRHSTGRRAGLRHTASSFDSSDPPSINTQLAEARATSLVLRATARAYRGFNFALMSRLNRAAGSLDNMVMLAVRCLGCIEQHEKEMRQLLGGDR